MTYPEDFLAFWAVYPSRGRAGNDKRAAFIKWCAAIKAGTEPQVIIEGACLYAEDMKAEGSLGTGFVKMARTWLYGECWEEPLERQARERAEWAGQSESRKETRAKLVKRWAFNKMGLPDWWTHEDVRVLLDEGLIEAEHARAVGVEPRLRAVG